MPLTTIVFNNIPELSDVPSSKTQEYWDALVPIGHGFVNISNPKVYGLKPGISTEAGIDRYSVAMYHQLHCLVCEISPILSQTISNCDEAHWMRLLGSSSRELLAAHYLVEQK